MTSTELLAIAKPILFNTDMVRAVLDGRKTATRRVIKYSCPSNPESTLDDFIGTSDPQSLICCAPCKIGDYLYVRETWRIFESFIGLKMYEYKADECNNGTVQRWRPSIHMPKTAARIFLHVTDVWVERLQDITEEHIKAEGTPYDLETYEMPCNIPNAPETYLRGEFVRLWDSTVKKQDLDRYGWDANPWVWVIEFERVNVDAR